ncbi:hypothetical protein C343_00395 [Cryptococcus neoformans C23]|uniref:Rab-GAP TBC domain-containing protein n=1 Tax=Cryptococcus neoformans (strain H99 / ATCC 208821 / CBS 10515 / FGSC 9487) TaxID=235443 RepID=J9VLG1_CRYN9|nr:hypothetical protein CNAG_00387 [Cryptococcus neoformans var. grubii H99]AUB21960.1 hypothetical protein CKF44_00387 [Cryptococcus neoformans var. grubii]OWZ47973.1 hypothetical protein C343_00395 [Cryptococcus neoformans var. grubii C23]OXC87233.1 hypothetical protein C344_00407 [Cryptococcus neoformans var. grubii AD1-7a]OXG40669.1 hypothetical protein C360_00446 [Cryptococcus neoformans var. grubii Bt15]OXG45333.1 hypothetical protein C359_00014 [Cryptococcus neoformans var. grubii Bt120|eukprot:XP_012046290.1 hypothetical protein CNAG_00387 [Cryptococcus neoformans var. grubii H99]
MFAGRNNPSSPNARMKAFQTLLDGSETAFEKSVDIELLRKLCATGIPSHPPHLRPLAYSLLLELLPLDKRQWKRTMKAQRRRYYNLMQTLMKELEAQPNSSSSGTDNILNGISGDIKNLKSPFWHRPVSYRPSSPLRPVNSQAISKSKGSSKERAIEESCSDSEEEVEEPILNRRAVFERLEVLSAARYATSVQKEPLNNITVQSPVSSVDSTVLSPQITLSFDPTPMASPSDIIRSPELIQSTPQPMIDEQTPSSITLLSSRPLQSAIDGPAAPIKGALLHPDSNREALIRLLYVFCQSNPQWRYRSSFVDIGAALYLIYAGGTKSDLDYVEEQTFWALSALAGDANELLSDEAMDNALDRFERRLHWVNPALSKFLQDRNVEPVLYAYRWLSSFFTQDVPPTRIPLLFDHIVSARLSSPEKQPKVDLIIDIGIAMVSLLKGEIVYPNHLNVSHGMWDNAVEEDEDASDAMVRVLTLLRSHPVERAGDLPAVLEEALDLQEIRLLSLQRGIDPDQIPLPPRKTVSVMNLRDQEATNSSWGKAVGSLWSSISATSISAVTSTPAPLSSPSKTLDNSFGRSPVSDRRRSDSVTSSVSAIQERFASLSKHFSPTSSPKQSEDEPVNLPRPLLLSGSTRSVSRSYRGDSTPSSSPRASPSMDKSLSPSNEFRSSPRSLPSRQSPGGLYKVGNNYKNRHHPLMTAPTLAQRIHAGADHLWRSESAIEEKAMRKVDNNIQDDESSGWRSV